MARISLYRLLLETDAIDRIKKNKWVPLTTDEIDDIKSDIYNLINIAYAPIGGHANVRSISDIGPELGDVFDVIDLDDDPDIDAVTITKKRQGGVKHVGMGHDGSSAAKSHAVNYTASQLKKRGHYVEVSGKLADILKSKGVDVVDDEAVVRRALKGKDIIWHGDGSYSRDIGGKYITKMMMGKPA